MPARELIRTSFFLTHAQRERLKLITEQTGSPLSFQLRRALDMYFADRDPGAGNLTPARAEVQEQQR
ncbi:MAG: hypothetical protein P4L84_05915 [Isosphaeraceae bacterium]|nr:hypothetical protein [Isosphaeraceae bacterium]